MDVLGVVLAVIISKSVVYYRESDKVSEIVAKWGDN